MGQNYGFFTSRKLFRFPLVYYPYFISILTPPKEDVSDFLNFCPSSICQNEGLNKNGQILCPFEIASQWSQVSPVWLDLIKLAALASWLSQKTMIWSFLISPSLLVMKKTKVSKIQKHILSKGSMNDNTV